MNCPARDRMHAYPCHRPQPHGDFHEVEAGWCGKIRWAVAPRPHAELTNEGLGAHLRTAKWLREQAKAALGEAEAHLESLTAELYARGLPDIREASQPEQTYASVTETATSAPCSSNGGTS